MPSAVCTAVLISLFITFLLLFCGDTLCHVSSHLHSFSLFSCLSPIHCNAFTCSFCAQLLQLPNEDSTAESSAPEEEKKEKEEKDEKEEKNKGGKSEKDKEKEKDKKERAAEKQAEAGARCRVLTTICKHMLPEDTCGFRFFSFNFAFCLLCVCSCVHTVAASLPGCVSFHIAILCVCHPLTVV